LGKIATVLVKLWRESWAIAVRILIELCRRRRSLVFWSVFPVVVLILNGLILAERARLTSGDAFAQSAPPTLVGAALFFSCVGGSVATVVGEREQKTLKRLFLTPLSGLSYFVGIFLAHCVIGVGQTLLVLILSLSLGAEFSGSLWVGAGIVLLSILGYVGVGFLLGTQLARRTEDVNALVATFGVPLLILGGAFLPVRIFPESLLQLARLNPIYHMNEALSEIILHSDHAGEARPHLAFLGLFSTGMILLGWLSYERMVRVERRL
jgi:ABC-2 type transport system permease protein